VRAGVSDLVDWEHSGLARTRPGGNLVAAAARLGMAASWPHAGVRPSDHTDAAHPPPLSSYASFHTLRKTPMFYWWTSP